MYRSGDLQRAGLLSGTHIIQPPKDAIMGFTTARSIHLEAQRLSGEREDGVNAEVVPRLREDLVVETSARDLAVRRGEDAESTPSKSTKEKSTKSRVTKGEPRNKKPAKEPTTEGKLPRQKRERKKAISVSDVKPDAHSVPTRVSLSAHTDIHHVTMQTTTVAEDGEVSVTAEHPSEPGLEGGKTRVKRKRETTVPKDGAKESKPRKRQSRGEDEAVLGEHLRDKQTTKPFANKAGAGGKGKAKKAAATKVQPVEAPTDRRVVSPDDDCLVIDDVSPHFGRPEVTKVKDATSTHAETSHESQSGGHNMPAPSRRRSWTPVEFELPPSNQHAYGEHDESGQETSIAFPANLSAFAYQVPGLEQVEATSAETGVKAKAPTRRKRVEAPEGVPKRQRAKKAGEKPKAEKPKKETVKKPKLPKPQRMKNVTDYALAAYRQQVEQNPDVEDSGVMTRYLQATGLQDELLAADATGLLQPQNPARSESPVKGSAKVNDSGRSLAERTIEAMRRQDFLFGTSSQLARDESPTLFRHTQQAINESEEAAYLSQRLSQGDSPSTSRRRVANAPHGTSLSVGPSDGNLWSVSARDGENKTFVGDDESRKRDASGDDLPFLHIQAHLRDQVQTGDSDRVKVFQKENFDAQQPDIIDEERNDSGFVDISELERAAAAEPAISQNVAFSLAPDTTNNPDFAQLARSEPGRAVLRSIDNNASPHRPPAAPDLSLIHI